MCRLQWRSYFYYRKGSKRKYPWKAVLWSLNIAVCLCFSSTRWKGVANKSPFVMKITHQPLPAVSQRNNKFESQMCHSPKKNMWDWVKGQRKKFALIIVHHNSAKASLPALLLSPIKGVDVTIWLSLGSSFHGHSSHQHHKTEIICSQTWLQHKL